MLRAMAKQAEAEREKRSKIIHAEGEFCRATPGGRCQAAGHRTGERATALSADFGGNRRGEEHHCDLPYSGGLFLGHTEAAGKAQRRSLEATRTLIAHSLDRGPDARSC